MFLNQTHTKPAFSSLSDLAGSSAVPKNVLLVKGGRYSFMSHVVRLFAIQNTPRVFALWQLVKQYRYLMKGIFAP